MQRPSAYSFLTYALIFTLVGSLFSVVLPAFQPSFALHENVTVNISGDEVTETYRPEDTVVITGIIDDVEEDEQVSLKFRDPSNSQKNSDDVEPDEDDGYFDYSYDLPSNAADGVWSVEAEYSGDQMYTYFIVDDEDDTITVELNNDDGIYEAGDEVTITGQVEDVDTEEENVLITVLDPANEEIYEEEQVELDDDEFVFSFDLDDDASHGRYAVIVTYDVDDQEGSALFEIEDPEDDGGGSGGGTGSDECEGGDSNDDGDLFAELGADSYEQGDTVCISGTIDGYDSDDDEDLEIVVQDPEDEEVDDYGDDSANVGSNGDFEYEFDLDDNAAEGTYTVIISYIGNEVELTFEVEDGGGGSDSSDLTVKLNKSTYLAGETMTVSGTVGDVADPDEGELVSVFLYDPESRVILKAGSSKYVTPSSSGAYSATITIPSDLEADEDYKVIVSYLEDQVEATFDITGVSSTPGDEITVETDKDEYEIGSTVEVSGEVPDAMMVDGQQLLIRVNKPDGNPCRIDPINVPSSGSYTYELVLGGVCGIAGEYEVEVAYGNAEASTSFELIGSSASTFDLRVEDDTYPIDYELSSGAINSMFVRTNENKLVITLDAEEDGQLTVMLPREVIDAIEDGEDIDFIVTTEDVLGNVGVADFEETENTSNERTLVINYEAGTDRIEIAGTQVVPEFSAIAAIVLAVAIVGIIVATARFGNTFSLFRQ